MTESGRARLPGEVAFSGQEALNTMGYSGNTWLEGTGSGIKARGLPIDTSLLAILTDSGANPQSLSGAAVGWHLSVKVHRDLWATLTGDDDTPGAGTCPVPAVGKPRAPCLSAVGDLHHALVTVHPAILARDAGGTADAANVPDVFVDEGVEVFALTRSHLPPLHHQVAVVVIAACPLRVNVLPKEPLVHLVLAVGGPHQP